MGRFNSSLRLVRSDRTFRCTGVVICP